MQLHEPLSLTNRRSTTSHQPRVAMGRWPGSRFLSSLLALDTKCTLNIALVAIGGQGALEMIAELRIF
jgi:hypothetical protein